MDKHARPPSPTRAQMGAEWSAWKQRTRTQHHSDSSFVGLDLLNMAVIATAPSYFSVLFLLFGMGFPHAQRARLRASVRSGQNVREKQGGSSSTASLYIHWAHITSWAPNLLPQPPLELVLRTVDAQSITH